MHSSRCAAIYSINDTASLDRSSSFKGAVQVRIAESAKQCFQLIEETRRVFAFGGAVGLPIALSARIARHQESQGKEHAKRI